MLALQATIKGLSTIHKDLKVKEKQYGKALDISVRVEGFRLMKVLKQEIREGHPGGQSFAPLSVIARRFKKGDEKALKRLAIAIRYNIERNPDISMHIGWTGPKVSKRWKALADMHQRGFVTQVTEEILKMLLGRAKATSEPDKRYFFIRKSTRFFRTPPRPIIDPFWAKHGNEARKNIQNNFRMKMAGKRI
uniref:Uncharacterized protein n=1 Tax=viral metagenome TaxID=1070528 RepID=A0A6M3KZI7_9ZZZZ